MHETITIYGHSSGKLIAQVKCKTNEETDLMSFLRQHNIPIASSCYGEGVCKKCMINDDVISCKVTVKDFIRLSSDNKVIVDYL